jgi:hypothetical protein
MNSSSALIRVDPWAGFWGSRLHRHQFSNEPLAKVQNNVTAEGGWPHSLGFLWRRRDFCGAGALAGD